MQVVNPELIRGKRVLIRMDLDVPIENGKILEDLRLKSGLDTLELCLQFAESVIVMGHIGRPGGREVEELSVKPIVDWFERIYAHIELPEGKLHVLENLRFEPGEDAADLDFAKELASYGDVFINEAFASHHPSASTTVLPGLLPHAAGLRFAEEVETLMALRSNPRKPLIAIIGGAKIEDKLPVINVFASIADAVLVGGKLPKEIKEKGMQFPSNVLVAKMNESGFDLSEDIIPSFQQVLKAAKEVVWSGPMGKYEDPASSTGTRALAQAIVDSGAHSIIGGGDTIAALNKLQMLDKMSFVSVGGGAMLKLLATGSLPTIEALS